jgi:hypothetical protein
MASVHSTESHLEASACELVQLYYLVKSMLGVRTRDCEINDSGGKHLRQTEYGPVDVNAANILLVRQRWWL